jgi:hypothetical protein
MVQIVTTDLLRSTESVLVLKFMPLDLFEFISSCIIFLVEITFPLTIRWYKPGQEKVNIFHVLSVLISLISKIKHHPHPSTQQWIQYATVPCRSDAANPKRDYHYSKH